MQRIIKSLGLLAGALAVVVAGASGAFFSDIESSIGNVFAAGDLDLLIDNESYYNGVFNEATSWGPTDLTTQKFFNFLDLKPGDWGEDTISLHVDTNDAYLCADVTLTSNNDNEPTEPELLDDTDTGVGQGELAGLVNFVWWADDGDNVLETDESPISQGPIGALALNTPFEIALADSDENIWGGSGPIQGDQTVYIGKAWCFGTMTLTPVAPGANSPTVDPGFTCDGSLLDDAAQTDSLTADISFEAVQARNNPNFQCTETEVFDECELPSLAYADAAGAFDQGQQKEGDPVLANRSLPSAAFGAPQTGGGDSDVGFPAGSFVSLGFPDQDDTASLVLIFNDNVVLDGSGADLRVYEVTGGVYPDEHVKVEVSQDGVTWVLADADAVRDEDIDLAGTGLAWISHVRLTDINNPALFPADADGYDVDAIEALNCGEPVDEEEPPTEPTTATLTLVKQVVNTGSTGDDQLPSAWTLTATGSDGFSGTANTAAVTNQSVDPGAYNLSETGPSGYIASAWVCTGTGTQNDSDTITLAAGQSATCTITNTEEADPVVETLPFFDNFGTDNGTDTTFDEAPGWQEGGAGASKQQEAGGGSENSPSLDGERFALILGTNGYICRQMNATGFQNLQLSYYWRGDAQGEVGDTGIVEFKTTGSCSDASGWTNLGTHSLATNAWSSLVTTGALSPTANNSTFLLRFRANSDSAGEDFRIDAVNVTGSAI